ncbi:MAG: FkbM family methyltransferase [Actinomycetota bacterium]|nr:FkbM family methyltransferase [Actinomycetota bacterium]
MEVQVIRSVLADQVPQPRGEPTGQVVDDRNVRYDSETAEVIDRVLGPDDNAIDVGAHTGQVLVRILARAPRGKHLAFEPLPWLAAELRDRYPDVEVYELALSDHAGSETFHYVVSNPAYSGLRRRRFDRPHEEVILTEVKTERLDALVPDDRPIRFVKVDVEGAELQVFRGARRTITRNKPYIVFEHGLGGSDVYGTRPEDVYDLLVGCGLHLNIMSRWLAGESPLTREQFIEQFDTNENYYFLAHPPDA